MTSKLQALIYGIGAALVGFVSWLADQPPSFQSGVLGEAMSICPVEWKPAVATTLHAVSYGLGLYALYHASHSGPQTPLFQPTAPTAPPKP